MRRITLVGLLFAFVLLGVVGCGGGGTPDPVEMTDRSFKDRLERKGSKVQIKP
jgi:hypothetical protein